MQFDFMPGRGTTDVLFPVRKLQEEYRDEERKLHIMYCKHWVGI